MQNRIKKDHWLLKTPIAHRGLHGEGAAENGKTAFLKAIESGYPIETDIQLTKDLEVVVFHDDSLKRMTGVDSLIWDKTYDEIKDLPLAGGEDRIMKFEEFLGLVAGKTPIVLEYKSQRVKKVIVDKTLPLLDRYNGKFVVQSFDPVIMGEIRKKRPDWIRGQLISGDRHGNISFVLDKLLSRGFFNFLSKPDFLNMQLEYPTKRKKGKTYLCWTVKSEEDLEKAKAFSDNFIFEKIRP